MTGAEDPPALARPPPTSPCGTGASGRAVRAHHPGPSSRRPAEQGVQGRQQRERTDGEDQLCRDDPSPRRFLPAFVHVLPPAWTNPKVLLVPLPRKVLKTLDPQRTLAKYGHGVDLDLAASRRYRGNGCRGGAVSDRWRFVAKFPADVEMGEFLRLGSVPGCVPWHCPESPVLLFVEEVAQGPEKPGTASGRCDNRDRSRNPGVRGKRGRSSAGRRPDCSPGGSRAGLSRSAAGRGVEKRCCCRGRARHKAPAGAAGPPAWAAQAGTPSESQ